MEDENKGVKNENTINDNVMIKKSTFTGLIIALTAVIAISAFFAGSYVTHLESGKVTQSDLNTAISRLEAKIETSPESSVQSNIQPIRVSSSFIVLE